MPELPEVQALVDQLRREAVGSTVGRVDVAALSVLKTSDPPIDAVHNQPVRSADRWGKYLGLHIGAVFFIAHLARAGWLRWADRLPVTPLRLGKGPIALRVHLGVPGEASGFDLTEAGTQKRLAVWLVTDPLRVPGISALGPDALEITAGTLARRLAEHSSRIKNVLTDQKVIAGIGNAYSDEILHQAQLSPFAIAATLSVNQIDNLHNAMVEVLAAALRRCVGHRTAELKGEKHSGLRVHGRTGLPCPACGDTVAEVSFADTSFQYCPTCQTGGKVLADRRLSRLLK